MQKGFAEKGFTFVVCYQATKALQSQVAHHHLAAFELSQDLGFFQLHQTCMHYRQLQPDLDLARMKLQFGQNASIFLPSFASPLWL